MPMLAYIFKQEPSLTVYLTIVKEVVFKSLFYSLLIFYFRPINQAKSTDVIIFIVAPEDWFWLWFFFEFVIVFVHLKKNFLFHVRV